jgi:hypothetical protein
VRLQPSLSYYSLCEESRRAFREKQYQNTDPAPFH